MLRDVADALAASGPPARLLVLEITETVLVDDPVAISYLAELRGMGVAVAIDDFGTRYTSIGRLRNMPVDILKIARSFVAAITDAGRPQPTPALRPRLLTCFVPVLAFAVGKNLVKLSSDERDQRGPGLADTGHAAHGAMALAGYAEITAVVAAASASPGQHVTVRHWTPGEAAETD